MSLGLLDLLDANVQLWHGGSHVQSPGYALLRDGQYLFGSQARASARLQPRDINTRYWWQLSTETLQPGLGPARHAGDLAHAHLQALHTQAQQPPEVLLAVPGSMQREQLSLLLGIMQQCPFDAVGLVNRSVALGSLYDVGPQQFHLEVQLHQAVLTELLERDGAVTLQRTVPLPGCGLLQLQERLVEIIAAAFVRQTRFDPRRKAATEQQLYDALPTALAALHRDTETNMEVNGYRARINTRELQDAGRRLFDSAREAMGSHHGSVPVIADSLAALLPGLSEEFPALDILQADDVRRALELHQGQLVQREQALTFITALPRLAQKHGAAAAPAPKPAAATVHHHPTHLLRGSVAQLLQHAGTTVANGWQIVRHDDGWQLRGDGPGVQVNGRDAHAGQVLRSGDTIASGDGATVLLIEVES